jgi:hypothetical protein
VENAATEKQACQADGLCQIQTRVLFSDGIVSFFWTGIQPVNE